MTPEVVRGVGIVGGGRWARVLADVLDSCLPPESSLALCSVSNPPAWESWIRERDTRRLFRRFTFPSLLEDETVSHVLIARRAANHADTCLACLDLGKTVFVEKPFCTTREDCDRLLDRTRARPCTVGYVLLYASGLQQFAAECRNRGPVRSIAIVWTDPLAELRYGELKRHDPTLAITQDVFPHAWSIIRTFAPDAHLRLESNVTLGQRQEVASMRLQAGECEVSLICARGQQARCRQLFVRGDSFTAHYDFTAEPGSPSVNDMPLRLSPGAHGPLRTQITAFLRGPAFVGYNSLSLLENSTETVLLPLEVSSNLRNGRMPRSELSRLRSGHGNLFAQTLRTYVTTVDFSP